MPRDVSVVIAAYNATAFLRDTLESVYRQTLPPAEVVLVDDASPDGTADLAEALARSAPVPLRVVRMPVNSGGPAAPLNAGISAATSELIATLDHDDRMRPDRLARQVACREAAPSVSLVLCRCEPSGGGETERRIVDYVSGQYEQMRGRRLTEDGYHIPALRAREASAEGCFALTCSNMLFPRSTWTRAGGFDPALRLSCDYGFQVAAIEIGDLAYVDGILNDWTVRESSLYHSAAALSRISERITILDRLRAVSDSRELRASIRDTLADEWMAYAYEARENAKYVEAFRAYGRVIRSGGTRRAALLGLFKLGPHMVSRIARSTRGNRRHAPQTRVGSTASNRVQ